MYDTVHHHVYIYVCTTCAKHMQLLY